jgi:hypothetical protein
VNINFFHGDGSSLCNLTVPGGGTGNNNLEKGKFLIGNGSNPIDVADSLVWSESNQHLGIGTANPLETLHVVGGILFESGPEDGIVAFEGDVVHRGKIVVQDEVDGGTDRGIFMWNTANAARGMYMASAGTGKSLVGGIATEGNGFSNLATRFRIDDSPDHGFIFESGLERLLMSLRGNDGRAFFAGDVIHDGKIVVQNGSDGGANRGIHLWSDDDPDFGAYVASASAGVSLGGSGSPVQGYGSMNDLCVRLRVSDDAARGFVFENSSEALLMSLRGSDGLLSVSGDIVCGGRLVVQDGQDGGNDRGIFLWDISDSARGIYMASANSTSLAGGTGVAVAGNGFSGVSTRLRIDDDSNTGIIFENSSEELLFSVRGVDGFTHVNGDLDVQGNATAVSLTSADGSGIENLNMDNAGSGILEVSYGGTGRASHNENKILIGNGTASIQSVPDLHWDFINNYFGIGTSNPVAKLDVAGEVHASRVRADSDEGTAISPSYTWTNDTSTGMYRANSNIIAFSTDGVERVRIYGQDNFGNQDSNVVNESSNIDDSNTVEITYTTFLEVDGYIIGDKVRVTNNEDSSNLPSYSWVDDPDMGMYRADSNVIAFSTAGMERLRIDDVGHVGIGVSNIEANSALHVDGDIRIRNSDLVGACNIYTKTEVDDLIDDVDDNLAEGLYWDSETQRLGISTVVPDAKLHVIGDTITSALRLSEDGTAVDPAVTWVADADSGMYRVEENALGFSTGGVERMRVAANGYVGVNASNPSEMLYVDGNIYATGEMTSASDRRLKTNLRSLESENCLAKLRQMSGYRFNRTDWNRLGGGAQKDTDFIGFVAQDVLQVMPELVKHDDKNDRYSVNYAHMAVVLTEAIKTLAKDKEALQNDVSELKRDVAELRRNAT